MKSLSYGIEQQVQAINAERMRQAMMAEQLRAAGIERQNGAAIIVKRLRGVIGNMLITAGERIRQEPVRRPKLERAPLKAARQA